MIEKIRVAAAGTGYFSQFQYDAWSRCPEVDLVGVADIDIDSANKVAEEYNSKAYGDVVEMLDDIQPDILDIITPPETHLKLIEIAAERGVNIICQKPFCGIFDAARKATKLSADFGVDLVVHENFRFQPWYQTIKRELEAFRLGKVFQVAFRLRPGDGQGPDAYLDRQPYFQKMERFLVHETAIHYVDVFRYLFGDVQWVWADLARLNPVIAGEDNCVILMGLADGTRGVLDGNRLSGHAAKNMRRTMGEMILEGENGELSLNGDGAIEFRKNGSNELNPIHYDWNDVGFGGDCVYLFTRHVVDHYVKGKPLMNRAEDYLRNLEVEEAIYESANDGLRKTL